MSLSEWDETNITEEYPSAIIEEVNDAEGVIKKIRDKQNEL